MQYGFWIDTTQARGGRTHGCRFIQVDGGIQGKVMSMDRQGLTMEDPTGHLDSEVNHPIKTSYSFRGVLAIL